MGLTIGRILLIAALLGGGYFVYVQWGGNEKLKATMQADPYDAANLKFTGGLYQEASDLFRQALAEAPDDPRAVEAEFRIARCCEQLKLHDQARGLYLAFAEKHPTHANAPLARERARKLELLNE